MIARFHQLPLSQDVLHLLLTLGVVHSLLLDHAMFPGTVNMRGEFQIRILLIMVCPFGA